MVIMRREWILQALNLIATETQIKMQLNRPIIQAGNKHIPAGLYLW